METKTITIRVNTQVAHFFETASEEDRLKMEALLGLKLSDVARSKKPLEEIMSGVSHNAQARGLTPEILDSILEGV